MWLTSNDMLPICTCQLKGASFINNAELPDGIALLQGCQIIWLDAQIHAQLFTIYFERPRIVGLRNKRDCC